jgi:predicted secreted protein
MNWFTGVGIYVIVWWLVFFTMLPIGARPPENIEPGHDSGAPEKPRVWQKALAASLIAGVLFAGIYYAISIDLISFRNF